MHLNESLQNSLSLPFFDSRIRLIYTVDLTKLTKLNLVIRSFRRPFRWLNPNSVVKVL